MFIRRTKTRSAANSGKVYYSYRLVESRREGDRVRQITLLSLGRHFDVAQKDWPDLCSRLDQMVGNQAPLITVSLDQGVEAVAQQIAAQLVARQPADTARPEYVEVDVHSLEQVNPRSVGVEHVALDALRQLGLDVRAVAAITFCTDRAPGSALMVKVTAPRATAPASSRFGMSAAWINARPSG